jgi:hypothetical protein
MSIFDISYMSRWRSGSIVLAGGTNGNGNGRPADRTDGKET